VGHCGYEIKGPSYLEPQELSLEQEQVPADWMLGYLVKLPKKDDLSQCGNWQGIILLSIPSKVLTRIILERLKEALDKRQEIRAGRFQAGQIMYRPHRHPAHHH
jgi:hypothetical protein